jgi:hypothetical protein
MSTPLGIGIVGCGNIALRMHFPAWAGMPDLVKVVAVADPNGEARERLRKLAGLDDKDAYADAHDLLGTNEVLTSLSNHSQIPTFSSRPSGLTLAEAYRVTPLLRAAFEAKGETITGRKIGFTNRQMWKVFGINTPVWGYTTSRTTHDLSNVGVVPLNDFSEPRIEPEIMFGLG